MCNISLSSSKVKWAKRDCLISVSRSVDFFFLIWWCDGIVVSLLFFCEHVGWVNYMHHLDSNFGSSICVIWTWRCRHSEMSWTLPWWDSETLLLFQYSGDNTSGLLPTSQLASEACRPESSPTITTVSFSNSLYLHPVW